MTAPAQMKGPLRQALEAPQRPPWRIRGLLSNRPDGPTVCLRLPAGFAETPEQALNEARKRFQDAMRALHSDRWRAFPVTDAEPEAL